MSSRNEHVRAQAQATDAHCRRCEVAPVAGGGGRYCWRTEAARPVRNGSTVSTGIDKVAASVSEVTHLRRLPDVLRALDNIITAPPSAAIGD
jgi:hypothetical protein